MAFVGLNPIVDATSGGRDWFSTLDLWVQYNMRCEQPDRHDANSGSRSGSKCLNQHGFTHSHICCTTSIHLSFNILCSLMSAIFLMRSVLGKALGLPLHDAWYEPVSKILTPSSHSLFAVRYCKGLPPGVREMNDRPQPPPEGLQVGGVGCPRTTGMQVWASTPHFFNFKRLWVTQQIQSESEMCDETVIFGSTAAQLWWSQIEP